MRLTFRMRLTVIYTSLFILFGLVLVLVVAVVLNRMLDTRSLQAIPAALENRTFAELRAMDVLEIVREARQAERQQLVRAALRVVLVVFLALSLAGAIIAWLLAGKVIRPLRQITAHAQSASSSNLSSRINLPGPGDELHDLADTYNALLARLDAAFRGQRHFSSHVSHELRTPLAIARAEADTLLARPDLSTREREFATRVVAAVIRNEALIESLLVLARAESRVVRNAAFDLADIVGDVAGELATMADQHGVRLELSLREARVVGDQMLLARMVSNVVVNGIRHNRPDGWVCIVIAGADGRTRLRVENSGPVVLDADALFTPFYTGVSSQPGLGLGLAIAREVVVAHDGTISAEARADGGLNVTVVLPSIPSDTQAR